MILEWWHWAVAGIVLILGELVVPAFVLVWFGLGGLLVALVLFVFPSMNLTAQMLLWTVASLAMVVLWFTIFKSAVHKTRIGMSDANIVGEVGLLVRDVAPFQKGQVRFQKPIVGSDTWQCWSDEEITSGERVKVVAVEGSIVKISKI